MALSRVSLTLNLLSAPFTARGVHTFLQHQLERRYRGCGLVSQSVSLPNGTVHLWSGEEREERPLLLVHGFGGDGMWGWAGQLPLAKKRQLIVPDLLWFGQSSSPVANFSTEFQAQTLIQLLDRLGHDQVDVVGISYGGFVALELAHQWPERFRKISIVDCPGHTYKLDDYRLMLDRKDLDSITHLIVPDNADGVKNLLRIAYNRPPPIPAFVSRDIYANMFKHHQEQKIRLIDHLRSRAGDLDPNDYALEGDHDVLVVWGQHDELFPAPLAYRLAEAIGPDASVHVIPGTNHAPNLERPFYFNDLLDGFLAAA